MCCPWWSPHYCRLWWQRFLTDMQWRRMAGGSRACYHMVDLHYCLCCPVHLPIQSSHLQSMGTSLGPDQCCGTQGSPVGSLWGPELYMKFIPLLLLSAPASTLLEEKSSLLRSVPVVVQTKNACLRVDQDLQNAVQPLIQPLNWNILHHLQMLLLAVHPQLHQSCCFEP